MVKIAVLMAVLIAFFSLISRPFIAPLVYQALSISQAHKIWFWAFEGIPAFKIFAALSLLGWCIGFTQKKVNFNAYKDKQNLLLLLVYLLVVLSDFFSPFPEYFAGIRAETVIGALNTIMIMYFVTIGLCCNERSLKIFIGIIVLTTLYYIYWANSAYFTQEWGRFYQGRLKGLPKSQYGDGNLMSVVYVMGMPFLLLAYGYLKNKYLKYGLLIFIPLLWHAIFLFGSRGAMLGLLVATLLAVYFLKSKVINWGIVVGLVIAFITQGGALLDRSESTVTSANDIYSDEPLNPRLVSWGIGLTILAEYPLLGAGSQRFQTASAYLRPGESPHVAHNTVISIAANNGVFAAICYLFILWGVFKNFLTLQKTEIAQYPLYDYVNKASFIGITGFTICSVFLDMLIFEPFYIMLIIVLINRKLASEKFIVKK
jgi:O-antigen ligase